MNVKCIALDLDGTTLYDDRHITARVRRALERAIDAGICIVIASGRCLDSLPACVRSIKGIRYAITSNGAAAYRLEDERRLFHFCIPESSVQAILEMTEGTECTFEAFCDGKAYAEEGYIRSPQSCGVRAEMTAYIQSTRRPVPDVRAFIRAHRDKMESIDIVMADVKQCARLFEEIRRRVGDVYVTASAANRIEMASREAGKHRGLSSVLASLGVSAQETAAFGDGDNDVEMLEFVRYGMAVQNATEQCRAAAWKIVPSNREDGVAAGIEELLGDGKSDCL